MKEKLLSHVRLLATPWTAAYQAPPSMGFSRQEYWSGVPLSSLNICTSISQMRKQRHRIQATCSRSPTGRAQIWTQVLLSVGFPGGSDGKESPCNAVDWNSIPGSGRTPGGGRGNSLHYSCLENPKNKRAWLATVHGIAKSQSQLKRLSLPTLLSEAHAFNSCAISIVQILACSAWEDWSRIAVS